MGNQRKLPEESPPLPARELLRQGPVREKGHSVSTQRQGPGSNTNQWEERHVRKLQSLQGTGVNPPNTGKGFQQFLSLHYQ